MDIAIVSEPCQREIAQIRCDGGTEHQSLGSGAFFYDFFELILELIFCEQIVGLIEDNRLYSGELKVRFGKKLHKTTRSRNDDVWIDGKAFELTFIGVASKDKTVPEVNFVEESF